MSVKKKIQENIDKKTSITFFIFNDYVERFRINNVILHRKTAVVNQPMFTRKKKQGCIK